MMVPSYCRNETCLSCCDGSVSHVYGQYACATLPNEYWGWLSWKIQEVIPKIWLRKEG